MFTVSENPVLFLSIFLFEVADLKFEISDPGSAAGGVDA